MKENLHGSENDVTESVADFRHIINFSTRLEYRSFHYEARNFRDNPPIMDANQSINQPINQNLLITRTASSTELESEAWAVTSGRVLRIVIEKMGLEMSFESI